MKQQEIQADVAVIGAGLGGIMAAISAAKQGKTVFLSEECLWIGGQLTSQAVPPDEHRWIEDFGCSQTYRQFRNRLREFYKQHFPVSDEIAELPNWDIGHASVSRIGHEPLVAEHLLREQLLPYLCNGSILLHTQTRPLECGMQGNRISWVLLEDAALAVQYKVYAGIFIDATETGELLPLSNTEYVIGAESKEQTGEPHAADKPMPNDMQPVTWVAAVEFCENEDHTIEKPDQYEYFEKLIQPYDQYPVLSWYGPDSSTGKAKKFGMMDNGGEGLFPLWSYRRIVYPPFFEKGFRKGDVVLINWPQNDYFMGNIFETEDDEHHRYMAKQLTLSFIYWMQTHGYPQLRLCPEVMGTADGLAQYPYIRESRRIKALYTIPEQDISALYRDEPVRYPDTVGIGCYHIDLHITTQSHTFTFYPSWPFEIPLRAMVPKTTENLIAGCKNIGTTHLTNGCFRLHPVEWNIGESAGFLAAFCLDESLDARQVCEQEETIKKYQKILQDNGIELHWDKDKITAI